jgi:hypothetical protein
MQWCSIKLAFGVGVSPKVEEKLDDVDDVSEDSVVKRPVPT